MRQEEGYVGGCSEWKQRESQVEEEEEDRVDDNFLKELSIHFSSVFMKGLSFP